MFSSKKEDRFCESERHAHHMLSFYFEPQVFQIRVDRLSTPKHTSIYVLTTTYRFIARNTVRNDTRCSFIDQATDLEAQKRKR